MSKLVRLAFCVIGFAFLATTGCRQSKPTESTTARKAGKPQTAPSSLPRGLDLEVRYLRRLLRDHPHSDRVRLRLAVLLMRAFQWQQAESLLHAVERDNPQSLAAQQGLAEVYSRVGFLDLEMKALRRQIEVEPRAQAPYLRLSAIYLDLRRFPNARRMLDRARQYTIESPDLYLAQANYHFALTHMNEAIDAARKATLRFPYDAHGLRTLSRFCLEAKRYNEALQTIQKALLLQPAAAGYHRQRAEILLARGRKGDYQEAASIFRGILSRKSQDLSARYGLGVAYARMGRKQQALEELERVAHVTLREGSVAYELGTLHLATGDKKRGKALLKEYRDMEQLSGELRRARFEMWSRPNNPDTHFRAARVYVAVGNLPVAIVELQRVVELQPSNKQARQRLNELYTLTGRTADSIAPESGSASRR